MKPFAAGTLAVANGLAEATKGGLVSVVGGATRSRPCSR